MDEIYRFRSVDRLLGDRAELVSQTIYFAEPAKLNDPLEPIRGFVWRGDTIAWTNLFRHYVNCLHHIYLLLRLSEPNRRVGASDIPINMRWDDPLSQEYADLLNEIWRDLNEQFDLMGIASRLGGLGRAARSDELEFYLSCIHAHAVAAIHRSHIEHGLQERGPADVDLSSALPSSLRALLDLLEQLTDEEALVRGGFEVTQQVVAKCRVEAKMAVVRPCTSVTERNRSFLLADFPHGYVQQLSLAVGPRWYAACFTESYGNSAQWAHYADGHYGVCLVFAVDNDEYGPSLTLHEGADGVGCDEPTIQRSRRADRIHFERVRYVESLDEVDFFARISRLPEASARTVWFADEHGNISSVAAHMAPHADIGDWRDALWSEYRRDACTKTNEWSYEKEHRLVTYSLLSDTLPEDQLTMTYDFPALKGIIFGITTSDDDKLATIDLIKSKCIAAGRAKFDFRQAYYSSRTGQIESFPLNLDVTQ
ncbi:MAG: DUF2971 domain-containing protein [bacterium]|nr:DUF2971 domain-containing protein [bacterium]